MTCDECRTHLQEFVDGELGSAEKAAIDAHLTGCQECTHLHRQLNKFTTTLIKISEPLKPKADFGSKVLRKFEETKAELKRVPSERPAAVSSVRTAVRTFPAWPFFAGAAVLVVAGLAVMLHKPKEDPVAWLRRGAEHARVQVYEGSAWKETEEPGRVFSGNRIEALDAPGELVEIDFGPGAGALLRSPCVLMIERNANGILVRPDRTCRLWLSTKGSGSQGGKSGKVLKLLYNNAWVHLDLDGSNAVDVEASPSGALVVSVKAGSAHFGNADASASDDVAEGYTRSIGQTGKPSDAATVDPKTFDWIKPE